MIHVFGDYEIDEQTRQVRHGGCAVGLEPKVFDLLLYLVRHRDRVVAKDEILAAVWPGVFVSDAALTTCIKRARRALADTDPQHRIIETVHRRGFRFVAPLVAREAAAPVAGESAAARRATVLQSGPFLGRAAEMRQLRALLTQTLRGRGRLVLIEGEPGIGKTRITEELAADAIDSGAEVLVGRCYEGRGVPAFWVWVQIIRDYAATHSTDELGAIFGPGAADIALLVPSLRSRLPDLEPSVPVDSAQGRARLFDSVAAFLSAAAARRPLLIVLEDLHWIAESSLLLLRFLAQQVGTMQLLILGTYRNLDLEPTGSVEKAVASWIRDGLCEHLQLGGLDDASVRALLTALVGAQAPAGVGATVSHRTQGNPFFIQEMVRYWVSEGAIDCVRGEFADARRIEMLGVPDGVRVVIGRRLAQLDDATRRVLTVAAVAGDTFNSRLIAATTGATDDQVLDAMDAATTAGLIREVTGAPGRYAFAHALTRATLYHGLTATRRAQLHLHVAATLEAHGTDGDIPLADLAFHFLEGAAVGSQDKAVHYAVQAAAAASAQFAHEDAARHLEQALALLERTPGGDERRRCEVLLALGEALRRSGIPVRSRDTFRRAADLAQQLNEPLLLADAAARLAVLYWPHFLVFEERPIGLLEEALKQLGKRNDALRARLLSLLAGALFMVPNSAERREALSRQAVDVAQRTGDPATLGRVLDDVAIALWDPNHVEERLALATQFRDLGAQVGDKEMEVKAYGWRILSMFELGNLPGVDADLAVGAPLADAVRQPEYLWFVSRFRFTRALLAGNLEAAERLQQESLAVGRRVDEGGAFLSFAVQSFALGRERGTLSELEPVIKHFVDEFPSLAWKWTLPFIYSHAGRLAEARAAFDTLAARNFRDLPQVGGPSVWLGVVATLADACADIGDRRHAATLYDLLQPYARQWVVFQYGYACLGSVQRFLGRLATTLSRWKDATAHFEAALRQHTAMATPCELARTQRDMARMLCARGRERDRRDAAVLLDSAARIARELRLNHLAEDAGRSRAHSG
jgi:DNA-binding winged helix-turn-helix (wHTH) protein/tetratricopeptide (TPR) repeat protein